MNSKHLLALALSVTSLALGACQKSGASTGPDEDKKAPTQGMGMRLVPITVTDPMINNIKAFTILVPQGWNYDAKVEWHSEFENLASANVVISNPANGDQAQLYPFIPYVWNPNALVPLPVGGIYLGGFVMAPISDPNVFVQQIVIPAFRSGIQNVQVLDRTPLTGVAQAIYQAYYNSNPNYGISAASMTIRYDAGGRTYDETFYCALSYATDPSLPGAVLWRPEFIFSLRAFAGELANSQALLQTCMTSVKPDMKWFASYLQVHKMWQDGQMAAIKSAGDLSKYLSGVSASVDKTIIDGYNQRQASEDRVYDRFSETIRGVETYSNPATSENVQLPSGYSNVWVNTSGEYFLSNETGIDPNVGSTLSWQQLTPEE
jgi:hypothetical protein